MTILEETTRLQVVERFCVVLTEPDPGFEEITRLVAAICEAPIALVSLVGADRQRFHARVGMALDGTERRHSFCAHLLERPGLLVVPDCALDPRFAENPLVTGESGVRFYAGASLVVPGGAVLGALCVMDRRPRQLTPLQEQALGVLSRQIAAQLESRRRDLDLGTRRSENLQRTVFESEPHCVKLMGRGGILHEINRAGLDLLGVEHAQPLLGQSLMPLVDPEDRAAVLTMLDAALAGERRTCEFRLRNFNDTEVWVQMSAGPFRTADGETLVLGISRDITVEKQAREALRQSTELFGIVVNETPDPIYVADLAGRYVLVNPAGVASTGLRLEELLGRDATAFCEPEQARHIMETDRRIMRSGIAETFEEHFESGHPDGVRSYLTTKVPRRNARGEVIGILGISHDITNRRRSERALQASEERFRSFMAHSPAVGLIVDAAGRIQYASPGFGRLVGLPPGEFGDRHLNDLLPAAKAAELLHLTELVIRERCTLETFFQGKRADGSDGIFLVVHFPINKPEGSCLAGSLALDVTERKLLAERMRRMVESNMQGVIFWNYSGEITRANDCFLQLVGYTREDLAAGRVNWRSLTPPEWNEADERAIRELQATGVCRPFEKYYLHRDGSRVPVLLGATEFQDGTGEGVSFVLDLTERKALEQQFLRAQRMESIGTLAGGIAHDLNNALMPITMSVDLLRPTCQDASSLEVLETIRQNAERGADMVRQVLSFARGMEGRRMEVAVDGLIRDIEKIANDTFLKHIEVRIDLAPDLKRVLADPTQIHQLLLNLTLNARDAMPQGGLLTISAANRQLTAAGLVRQVHARPGPHVMIEVADTGSGMTPEVLEKIFDPFFTTKEIGKGTGLGLSSALGIAHSHHGFVEAESSLGMGSRFRVYLPAQQEPVAPAKPAPKPERPRGFGQLVLVVDDEPSVRRVTRHALEKHGYRVLEAADGTEAIVAFEAHAHEIDVVLTDLMMPGLNGREMIQQMRRSWPEVRIIATTGVSFEGDVATGDDLDAQRLLPKPYTIAQLLQCLQEVLERDPR